MPLTSLQTFLRQILDTLPLSQRWKINQIHVLTRRRTWKQESLGPVLMALLFYSSDTVRLNTMSQISLAFFLFSPCLFLFRFPPCFFLFHSSSQFLLFSFFFGHPHLFSCSPFCPLLLLFLLEPCLYLLSLFYELLLVPFIIGVEHHTRVNGVVQQHCGLKWRKKIS